MRDTSPSSCRAHRDIVSYWGHDIMPFSTLLGCHCLHSNEISQNMLTFAIEGGTFSGQTLDVSSIRVDASQSRKGFPCIILPESPVFMYTSSIGKLTASYAGGSQYSGSPNHSRKDGGSRSRGYENTVTSEESKQGCH